MNQCIFCDSDVEQGKMLCGECGKSYRECPLYPNILKLSFCFAHFFIVPFLVFLFRNLKIVKTTVKITKRYGGSASIEKGSCE
jgi:hypothetical protein